MIELLEVRKGEEEEEEEWGRWEEWTMLPPGGRALPPPTSQDHLPSTSTSTLVEVEEILRWSGH